MAKRILTEDQIIDVIWVGIVEILTELSKAVCLLVKNDTQ